MKLSTRGLWFGFAVRCLITAYVLVRVYGEAGIWTAIALGLCFVGFDAQYINALRARRVMDGILEAIANILEMKKMELEAKEAEAIIRKAIRGYKKPTFSRN
jgi:hypothetical protein